MNGQAAGKQHHPSAAIIMHQQPSSCISISSAQQSAAIIHQPFNISKSSYEKVKHHKFGRQLATTNNTPQRNQSQQRKTDWELIGTAALLSPSSSSVLGRRCPFLVGSCSSRCAAVLLCVVLLCRCAVVPLHRLLSRCL